MAELKIIDHYKVDLKLMDDKMFDFKSDVRPVVDDGFLAIRDGLEYRHFNLATIKAWMYTIVEKE